MRKILKDVLRDIKPSKAEQARVRAKIRQILSAISARLKRAGIAARPVLGGSFAKGTWLKGDSDVDIFVLFSLRYKGKDISALLESALRGLRAERLRGSRPYFRIAKSGLNFELVPALAIKKPQQAENIIDFSQGHVGWFKSVGRQYIDDILLAKQFMKAARCYGAESYIGGFSGHVVDTLVVYYGGFVQLLKAALRWKPKVVIDLKRKPRAVLKQLNLSKVQGPLVVVDPVQPGRNAAAAVTQQAFDRFVSAAREWLAKPTKDAFLIKPVSRQELASALIVDFKTLPGPEAIAGAAAAKVFQRLCSALQDFGLDGAGWEWDRKTGIGFFWFFPKVRLLPEELEVRGPPAELREHVARFRAAHPNAYLRQGRLWARAKRPFTKPDQALRAEIERVRHKLEWIKLSQ